MPKTWKLTALIERGGGGFVALCPELDVASQGDSVDEARLESLRLPAVLGGAVGESQATTRVILPRFWQAYPPLAAARSRQKEACPTARRPIGVPSLDGPDLAHPLLASGDTGYFWFFADTTP